MENRWVKAATILRPTIEVCGRRLLPFCLLHRVALEAINSPILNTGDPITPKHLVAAVRILSCDDLEEIRKPSTMREHYWVGRMTYSTQALIVEVAKLNEYFMEQALWPRFWIKDESEKKAGEMPWVLAIIASLTRNGCTLKEAWTMPESEAIWLHVAHCQASGADIKVVSETEWEAMEKYRRESAENNETRN